MSVSNFISRAACRGHRPARLDSQVGRERPALVARLLQDRGVARFIIAPSGYGKTFLAAEYAETIHSWVHVFWVNAQSPCFVRDLDAGTLASSCIGFDGEVGLVVFDDVPRLDDERAARLSAEIDALIGRECEVIVTCVPSCDVLGSLQRDRFCLRASDLLLDDGELDETRPADERVRKPADRIGPASRVPVLAWGEQPACAVRFARGSLQEDLPLDVLRAMCHVLVLQSGTAADLSSIEPFDAPALEELVGDYPHLGFDVDFERFEAACIAPTDLAAPLRKQLARLMSGSPFGSSEQLVRLWANVLLRNGRPGRACEVMREIGPRGACAGWAIDHAGELVRQACFFPMVGVLAEREKPEPDVRARLDAMTALCRRVLGDEEGAARFAKRNAFNGEAPESARVLSQLVAARAGSGAVAERAHECLEALSLQAAAKSPSSCSFWELLAQAWTASFRGVAGMARLWFGFAEAGVNEDVLCIGASWLFGLCEGSDEEFEPETALALHQAERLVRRRLADGVAVDRADYFAASAGLAMEEAHARGAAYEGGPLGTGSLILLRRVEMNILSQRRLFEESAYLEQARQSNWAETHPSASFAGESGLAARSTRSVPLLTLKIFGCFEVSVGGVPVDYSQFKRQNTRTLLVLLAVNHGRELSREALACSMWPTSSEDVARKNFYTVWSHLRRALALPDGTCPYLVRHQYGCSLDPRYVESDVERLDEICRELLFSTPNIERWSTLFAEVDRDFSSDLLPSESKNALIAQARDAYRARLVDALVAATVNVVETDDSKWGVWFARAAIGRDETREDAYVALMRAQIAVNQRTAAMMTYLTCRRVLADRLGIDPAPETTALYESLLDS